MYLLRLISIALLATIFFSACGDQKSTTQRQAPAATINTLKSTLDREVPDTNEINTTLIVNGNSDFAFGLAFWRFFPINVHVYFFFQRNRAIQA